MLQLPDGNLLDMRWKSVSYIVGIKRFIFTIIPMLEDADIVCVPNEERCNADMDISLRNEFIFLTQVAEWKRDLRVVEMNITPCVSIYGEDFEDDGSLEKTEGGKKLESSYLFDPQSPLTKEQVKEIYIKLEAKFAENIVGEVEIVKNGTPDGSIMEKITIPSLERNQNAKIIYV